MVNSKITNWHQQIQQFLLAGNYHKVASFYESAIEKEPEVISNYWYLGLSYLLQDYEEEAQATWLLGMSRCDDDEAEERATEISQILDLEAERQEDLNALPTAWLIRQHLREITPGQVNNLLHLLLLSLNLNTFTPEFLEDWQVLEFLSQCSTDEVNVELLLTVIKQILKFRSEETLVFVETCVPHLRQHSDDFINTVIPLTLTIAYQYHQPIFAAKLSEFCLQLHPNHQLVLHHLSCFYTNSGEHQKAIATAKQLQVNCRALNWRLLGSYLVLRALFCAGAWLELEELTRNHESLLLQIIEEQPQDWDKGSNTALMTATFFLAYWEYDVRKNKWIRNQISQLFQRNLHSLTPASLHFVHDKPKKESRPLKIGYISHTLHTHSVGWLCRWLFRYHDRESFHLTIYCVNQDLDNPFTQAWFIDQVDAAYTFPLDAPVVAEQIYKDQIDILIDLDSITLDCVCEVMAMKPAPIQATWLGWDATGMPAVDYFIADPYVLPDDAQEYYQEKIWRLPQTYLAVDGFEVGTPTIRRDQLEVPSDAIVYFSGQKGFKRHPDTLRLQMQIIKEVPNSYFLVKGGADELTIKEFFTKIAEEVGVDPQRLRFLGSDPNEYVHRANLAIADVVLDTFPYNGATTTLETLWMGIPLVTKVGQQFAARNSYAFMLNAGVTEGIAWTDEEYIEWGVRLGKDEALRHQVAGKLKASRQTSPLWNAEQFTRDMEKAYQQMWERYISS